MGCYCSATSFPPCSYCENHGICEHCEKTVHNNELQEIKIGEHEVIILCENCMLDREGEKSG